MVDPLPLQLLAEYFPNGIARYAIGGLFVGLGASLIYLGTGISAGASSFLESTLSYVSDQSRFQRYVASRDWRLVFTLGIVLGAGVYWRISSEGSDGDGAPEAGDGGPEDERGRRQRLIESGPAEGVAVVHTG